MHFMKHPESMAYDEVEHCEKSAAVGKWFCRILIRWRTGEALERTVCVYISNAYVLGIYVLPT